MADDSAQQSDPTFVPPVIEVSTGDVAYLAGLLIGAQEYLETLDRVAMYESRPGSRFTLKVRLARDVLVQWSRQNVVSAEACICPVPGATTRQRGCPVHDPAAAVDDG